MDDHIINTKFKGKYCAATALESLQPLPVKEMEYDSFTLLHVCVNMYTHTDTVTAVGRAF